jgi:hypothetical protein
MNKNAGHVHKKNPGHCLMPPGTNRIGQRGGRGQEEVVESARERPPPAARRRSPTSAVPLYRRRSPTSRSCLGLGEPVSTTPGRGWEEGWDGERRVQNQRARKGHGGLPEPEMPPPGTSARCRAAKAELESLLQSLALWRCSTHIVFPGVFELPPSESLNAKRYARGLGLEFAGCFTATILSPSKQLNWPYSSRILIPCPDSVHANGV